MMSIVTHRSGNISTSNSLDGGIEVVKGFALNNLGTNLATNTEGRETTLNNDQP